MEKLYRIAHIEDGLVINVSVATQDWLDVNESEFFLRCPEYVGVGWLYDSQTKEFVSPEK